MAAAEELSTAERQLVLDRKLDEIDRALLGLLPRSERLAIVADVEARLQALGDGAFAASAVAADSPIDAPIVSASALGTRTVRRRSRLAFSSGVLGIVAAGCLLASPIVLITLSAFGEMLGETFSVLLFGLVAMFITLGGCLAVGLGAVGLLRLARRGQSATGTGWAITGLCTGSLPMLLGVCGVLSIAASMMPSESVYVTWSASPAGPVPYQVAAQPADYPTATPMVGPLPSSPYGTVAPPMTGGQPVSQQPLPPALPAALPPELPAVKPSAIPEIKAEPKAEPKAESTLETKPELKSEPAILPSAAFEEPAEVED
jgi:hypothetical protein